MRKLMWILGVVAAVGLAVTAGTAQERQGSAPSAQADSSSGSTGGVSLLGRRPSGAAADVAAPSGTPRAGAPADAGYGAEVAKYERTRPAAGAQRPPAGLKNYHRDLFGTEPPALNSQSARTGQPLTTLAAQPAADPTFVPIPGGNQPQLEEFLPGEAAAIRQASAETALAEPSGLIQADYTRPSSTDRQQVEQVSHERPATPLPLPEQSGPLQLLPMTARNAGPVTPATRQVFTNLTGDAPRVRIEWRKLSEINVGQPCQIELVVINDGQAAASGMEIDAWFPRTVRLTSTTPEPDVASECITWALPALGAGEEQRFTISLIPSQRGEIAVNANVRFTSAATAAFRVEEPLLAVAVQGVQEVMVGEPATQVVTVSNPGTGAAQNVTLDVSIPEGLEHPRGRRLALELGSLAPGENRSVRLSLTAVSGGEQIVEVDAKAGTGLRQTAVSKIRVLSPSLTLAVKGPALRYVGRDARYTVTVTNDSQAATSNVRAVYLVPKGFEFQGASGGGQFDARNRTVGWFLGSLTAGKQVELELRLKPVEPGDYAHVAKVVSEQGITAEATSATKIEGTAALVLELTDLDDPVEIGRETIYDVQVRNEGSMEARNVGLSLELPPGMELVNVEGPSQHLEESGLVVFKALPALPAGKSLTFRIHVKGTQEGNQRVRARLTSDSVQEPLTTEELTKFYAD